MLLVEILLIAVGLSMDAFAVSVGASSSARPMAPRASFRLSFHFGLFQCLMPIAGWSLGTEVAHVVAGFAGWLAWALLTFVGAHMVYAGVRGEAGEHRIDPSKGMALVMLSVATSVDAFAVGFSLAMLRMSIWYPAFVIGLVTGTLSLVGVRLGRRLGTGVGRPMEIVGGLLLIGIGLRIVMGG